MKDKIFIEKYRPGTLDEVVGQDEIVERLKNFVKSGNIPHLLFAGSAGSGKTSAAICIARDLYGDIWDSNFLELNSSMDRGIDMIRDTVKRYAASKAIDFPFKIILLDEADNITKDGQSALRRTMEQYSGSCRFFLTCNYSSSIIEPIQSRCAVFRFKRLKKDIIIKMIDRISVLEKINIEEEALEAISYISNGDLRKAIGILNICSNVGLLAVDRVVTVKNIYAVCNAIKPEIVQEIIKKALSRDFFGSVVMVERLIIEGLAGEDILKEMMSTIFNMNLDGKMVVDIVDRVGDAHWRIS